MNMPYCHNESFNATEIIVYQIAKNYPGMPSDICTAPVMCWYSYMLRRRLASFWKIHRCYFSAAHARVSVSISIFRMKSIGRYRYSFYLQKCIGDTDSIGIGIGICVGRYRYVICLHFFSNHEIPNSTFLAKRYFHKF